MANVSTLESSHPDFQILFRSAFSLLVINKLGLKLKCATSVHNVYVHLLFKAHRHAMTLIKNTKWSHTSTVSLTGEKINCLYELHQAAFRGWRELLCEIGSLMRRQKRVFYQGNNQIQCKSQLQRYILLNLKPLVPNCKDKPVFVPFSKKGMSDAKSYRY